MVGSHHHQGDQSHHIVLCSQQVQKEKRKHRCRRRDLHPLGMCCGVCARHDEINAFISNLA